MEMSDCRTRRGAANSGVRAAGEKRDSASDETTIFIIRGEFYDRGASNVFLGS